MEADDVRTLLRHRGLVLLTVATFVLFLDTTVVNVALREIGVDLGGDTGALQRVVSAYVLALTVGLVAAGPLVDRFGPVVVATTGMALFTLAAVLCATAGSLSVLVGARALQGLGAASVAPAAYSIISASFRAARRSQVVAAYSAVSATALAVGPLLGGVVVLALGWRGVFWLAAPIGALVCCALPWSGPARVVAAGRRADRLPTRSLVGPRVLMLLAAGGFAFAGLYALVLALPLHDQVVHDLGPLRTGVGFLPLTLALAGVAATSGWLAERLPTVPLVAGGLALMAGGTVAIRLAALDPGAAARPVALAAIGAGTALVLTPSTITLLRHAGAERAGAVSGASNVVRNLGGAAGALLMGVLLSSGAGAAATADPLAPRHIDAALTGVAVVLAVAAALVLTVGALTRERPSSRPAPARRPIERSST
jgi:MFS transporter, DHA2 family, methylenomycin A resistance protein